MGDFSNLSKITAAKLSATDDALHLKLAVPGMQAKDPDIQVMADKVVIAHKATLIYDAIFLDSKSGTFRIVQKF